MGVDRKKDIKNKPKPEEVLSNLNKHKTTAAITAEDLRWHIETLSSDEFEGRLTGTKGEKLATAHVAGAFAEFGLEPAGDNETFFQKFEFESGVSLGKRNLFIHSPFRKKLTIRYSIRNGVRLAFPETQKSTLPMWYLRGMDL